MIHLMLATSANILCWKVKRAARTLYFQNSIILAEVCNLLFAWKENAFFCDLLVASIHSMIYIKCHLQPLCNFLKEKA